MLTFVVEKELIDINFTLQELLNFSKMYAARVIIKNFSIFEKGVVTQIV